MSSKEYDYIEPPLLIKEEILGAAIDAGEWQDSIYSIEGEDLALIGTSEHALLGLHANEAFFEKFGMLFQGGALFDSLTVWQNVAFRLLRASKKLSQTE